MIFQFLFATFIPMQGDKMLLLGLGVLAVVLIAHKSANAAPVSGNFDLNSLSDQYGNEAVSRLNAIYAELLSRGYSDLQILFMLSQILHETGLFTNVANYSLMNQNNYAGLTTTSGGYASYNSISDFVDAYDGFLTKGSNPLGAANLTDFNNRLVANHYYTDSPSTYYNALFNYYNLLVSTSTE